MKKTIFNSRQQKGFSLIELLISIVVLVALGWITTGVMFSVLRGSNKTNVIENIRQNGNYALNQISKNIEYAQTFDGVSVNGATYVPNCLNGGPSYKYQYLKVTTFNSGPLQYKCLIPPPPGSPTFTVSDDGGTTETSIVDTSSTSSIAFENCSITCIQTNDMDVPIIGISFTLKPVTPSGLVEDSSPPIEFKTSVAIRNYKKE